MEKMNHALYKIELSLLKILPMLLALVYLLNSILSYFGIDTCILSYIGGVSIVPLIFMYVSSYVFKFCEYHRMFLHYIVICDIINTYDLYVGIDISDLALFNIHMILAGIVLFIVLYLYLNKKKHGNNN